MRYAARSVRSSFSSQQLTCELERSAFSRTTRSDLTLFWPRLAYRFCSEAIEIDGEHYWDGGYMGKPAIFPLIYNCDSRDVVFVDMNPIERPDVPKTAGEILNRINELSFNSSLMREIRSVCFCDQADRGAEDSGQDDKAHADSQHRGKRCDARDERGE